MYSNSLPTGFSLEVRDRKKIQYCSSLFQRGVYYFFLLLIITARGTVRGVYEYRGSRYVSGGAEHALTHQYCTVQVPGTLYRYSRTE